MNLSLINTNKMKRYNLYIAGLLLVVFMSACDRRDYDVPVLENPKYETTSERVTIADLKTFVEPKIFGRNNTETNNNFGYLQNPANINIVDQDGNRAIVSLAEAGMVNKHIKAYVVGNDESGNIYKQVYLQDETGAILVIVNLTGLFAQFPVGQQVIVELDNLSVGKYYGAYQIGAPQLSKSVSSSGKINYGMNRLNPRFFFDNIHRNEAPDVIKVNSLMKTYSSIPASSESVRNTIVRLNNVSFDGGGTKQFAPMVDGVPTTGTVKLNVNGVKVDVRTSGYANFAGDTVPTGTGTVTAILSQYFDNLQITIRKRSDLQFNN
jgi:hypothetical protein